MNPNLFASFPLAANYTRPDNPRPGQGCHEPHGAYGSEPPTERHLQCVWADPAWRPTCLRTTDGEQVEVVDPGQWNLEAGPDFLNAVLETGPDRRQWRGDVEVHVHASDWKRHRHAGNSAYAGVVAHVVYEVGAAPCASQPPGVMCIALREALQSNPTFAFDAVDLAAYPYAFPEALRPCADVWRHWPWEETCLRLETAGQYRLWRKAVRLAAGIAARGPGQTLYEETLAALGYKHNKKAFRDVAIHLPLATLRTLAGGDALQAYAVLLGTAGLLPERLGLDWDAPTRRFVRKLWDIWWKSPSSCRDHAMPRSSWCLSGLRPHNHPRRRLAAAAALFGVGGVEDDLMASAVGAPRTAEGARRIMCGFQARGCMDYWDHRLGFAGTPSDRAIALLGDRRAADIWINVLLPFLAARGERPDGWLGCLPAGEDNASVRHAAHGLLGRDHNPALLRRGLVQQGLLQILYDYCVHGRLACRRCALARVLGEPAEGQGRFEKR